MAGKEKGSIEIDVIVDSTDAIDGFDKAGQAAQEMGKKLEKTDQVIDDAGRAAEDLGQEMGGLGKSVKDQSGLASAMQKEYGELKEKLDEAAKAARQLEEELEESGGGGGGGGDVGAKLKKGLPDDDDIDGLTRFRDATGEADSAIAGMAAAADHVSPELAGMMRVVGDTSGFMEAASRGTALFGGSLGTLIRIGAPVVVAIGAIAFAHNKLSGGLKESEQRLKDAHKEMEEGIKTARAYGARMESTRLTLGLLSQAQFEENEAKREAAEGTTILDARLKKEQATMGMLNRALDRNWDAQQSVEEQTGKVVFQYANLNGVLESVDKGLKGGTDGLITHKRVMESGAGAVEFLADRENTLEYQLKKTIETIKEITKSKKAEEAQTRIAQALRSGDIDQIQRAAFSISDLDDKVKEQIRTKVRNTLESLRAAKAADSEADAIRSSGDVFKEVDTDKKKAMEERIALARMLADATGGLANIELDYAAAIQKINEISLETGITEEQRATLIRKAIDVRREAVDSYEESLRSELSTTQKILDEMVTIEKSISDQIRAEYDNRAADLLIALGRKQITQEQSDSQRLLAEERMNKEIGLAREAAQQEQIAQFQMVSSAFMGLMDANISAVNAKLDEEQAMALANAKGNSKEQAKIQADFDKKRAIALEASFKKKKQLEIANALISGASAVVAALAPPPVGLGPVAGAFLAAIITATTGAQIGAIQSQNPKFHDGGIVGGDGDQPITAQGGEVVLNRDAVDSLGGPGAADSLNSGTAGTSGPVVIQMTYKQRVFDQIIVDNLAKGGPLQNAINNATSAGKRGRIGGLL